MRTKISFIFILFFLHACVIGGPPNNAFFFDQVDKLNKLEGVYQNLGESRQGLYETIYLSQLIWPKDKSLSHAAITSVDVRAVNDTTLLVKAIGWEKEIVKEAKFTKGKDFEINFGHILLKQRVGFIADVFLGPYYERSELGIDTQGSGKNRQYTALLGLGFLIVPVAGGGWDDIRFVRIGN